MWEANTSPVWLLKEAKKYGDASLIDRLNFLCILVLEHYYFTKQTDDRLDGVNNSKI